MQIFVRVFIYLAPCSYETEERQLLMNKKAKFAFAMASILVLAACGGESKSEGYQTPPAARDPEKPGIVSPLADGVFDFTEEEYETKLDILAALESFALKNHLAGIPLYDDASYERFSERITLKSDEYITNYGFGVGESTIDPDGIMCDGPINESVAAWKSYFHGYTSTDSGTFNYWDSTGADVADRASMVSGTYYEVEMTPNKDDYMWVAGLAKQDEPIMLKRVGEGSSQHLEVETDSSVKSSKYWRVPLKTGEDGIVYNVPETSRWKDKYRGRGVELQDYITPFKAMFDNNFARATGFGDDSSGFEGVLDYIYSTKHTKENWDALGVGIQINEAEGAIDFTFITPKTVNSARTNLSGSLLSPVPSEFLTDIGGAGNYGKQTKPADSDWTKGMDNIISCGAYIPEYWETGKKLVYTKNDLYFDKDRYSFAGVTEDVFEGTNADKAAYAAFKNNQLDEVTIPVSEIKNDYNKPTVHHTKGSTVLKLNVNSTTEAEWEYFFGEEGTVYKHSKTQYWDSKPLMHNEYFLDGVYYSINRLELSQLSGRNPALSYLSGAYTQDPDGKKMYRDSPQGKSVLAEIIEQSDEYGHNDSVAQDAFEQAIRWGYQNGELEIDSEYEISCIWRYQDTIDNLGDYIKSYVEDNFNAVGKKYGISLVWNNEVAGTQYTDCYTRMDHGEFDFAEGAITGNVLNPLDFMSTICTNDLAQGFCLNWGHPTEKVYEEDPLVYGGYSWSYDALYKAANSAAVVSKGVNREIASNPRLEAAEGGGISLVVDYPEITDENGRLLIEFSARNGGIFGSADGSFSSGYYASNPTFEVSNGSCYYTVKKSDVDLVKRTTQNCAYFLVQVELVYTFNGKVNNKTIYATASAEELGLN